MARHTNSTAVLAHSDRLTPEDLLLDAEARLVWLTVTSDRDIMRRIAKSPIRWIIYRLRRESARSCPLELLGRIIVWLACAGVSEARLRLIPLFLTRVIENVFAGAAHRSLEDIDRDEQRLESRENELALERRIAVAQSPEALEREAEANEAEAAVSIERGRILRRMARQLRGGVLSFPASPQLSS